MEDLRQKLSIRTIVLPLPWRSIFAALDQEHAILSRLLSWRAARKRLEWLRLVAVAAVTPRR